FLIELKARISLAQGNLAGARAVIGSVPKDVDQAGLVAFFAMSGDLYWVLEDAQQALVLQLRSDAWDGDRGTWGSVLAQTYWLRGDRARARVYADSARIALEEQLRAAPQDAQRHVFYGLCLAYLGRKTDAINEGRRGVALLPITKDARNGPYLQHQLV